MADELGSEIDEAAAAYSASENSDSDELGLDIDGAAAADSASEDSESVYSSADDKTEEASDTESGEFGSDIDAAVFDDSESKESGWTDSELERFKLDWLKTGKVFKFARDVRMNKTAANKYLEAQINKAVTLVIVELEYIDRKDSRLYPQVVKNLKAVVSAIQNFLPKDDKKAYKNYFLAATSKFREEIKEAVKTEVNIL